MTTLADLNGLLVDREAEHLEFKEAKNNYDFGKLVAYCSASPTRPKVA